MISRLTDLRARPTTTLHYAVESATVDRPGQLVVAILGRMTAEDANALLRLRRNRAQGLAMVLDVDTFADQPGSDQQRAQHELAARILTDNQWRVIGCPAAWASPRPGRPSSNGAPPDAAHRPQRDRRGRLGRAGLPHRPTADLRWQLPPDELAADPADRGASAWLCAGLGSAARRCSGPRAPCWPSSPSDSASSSPAARLHLVPAVSAALGRRHRAHADPGLPDGPQRRGHG